MNDKTEFVDKTGRPIYVGDIIQHRMSGSGKSGAQRLRVVWFGKNIHVVSESTSVDYGGVRLATLPTEFITVVETKHMRGY